MKQELHVFQTGGILEHAYKITEYIRAAKYGGCSPYSKAQLLQ